MQADSLLIPSDTAAFVPDLSEEIDSVSNGSLVIQPDTLQQSKPVSSIKTTNIVPKIKKEIQADVDSIVNIADTTLEEMALNIDPVRLFSNLTSSDSSIVQLPNKKLNQFQPQVSLKEYTLKDLRRERRIDNGWVLGLTLFVVLILIVVRNYFQKYLSTIITSIVKIQLSDKLLREKNVLVRRVFFLLNTSYVVIVGLYLYQLAIRTNFRFSIENNFILYLTIQSVLIGLILLRLASAKLIAFIFDATPVIRDYIHNTFIINKNLGIYLIPIVISIFYVKAVISNYLFTVATILILLSLIFRYVRAIQIILKHNIFLFYSILYLCCLEIIPVLIGIKYVLTQR